MADKSQMDKSQMERKIDCSSICNLKFVVLLSDFVILSQCVTR